MLLLFNQILGIVNIKTSHIAGGTPGYCRYSHGNIFFKMTLLFIFLGFFIANLIKASPYFRLIGMPMAGIFVGRAIHPGIRGLQSGMPAYVAMSGKSPGNRVPMVEFFAIRRMAMLIIRSRYRE
jgi:hypothetical protein